MGKLFIHKTKQSYRQYIKMLIHNIYVCVLHNTTTNFEVWITIPLLYLAFLLSPELYEDDGYGFWQCL